MAQAFYLSPAPGIAAEIPGLKAGLQRIARNGALKKKSDKILEVKDIEESGAACNGDHIKANQAGKVVLFQV